MKMKKMKIVTIFAIVAMTTFVGCEFFAALLGALFAVDGTVINAMADKTVTEYWKDGTDSLEGATITMTQKDGDHNVYNGTVGADGTFFIENVGSGSYIITGSHSGWTFVPTEVEITGAANTLPPILAYPTQDAETILIITEWENTNIDVDSHLIIDTDDNIENVNPVANYHVSYQNKTATGVQLDRDVVLGDMADGQPPVETMRITSNPLGSADGWLRFYLNAYSTASLTGLENDPSVTAVPRASAKVHVMQGTTLLGTWTMPIETLEPTIGVLKIEVDYISSSQTDYYVQSFGNYGDNTYRAIEF